MIFSCLYPLKLKCLLLPFFFFSRGQVRGHAKVSDEDGRLIPKMCDNRLHIDRLPRLWRVGRLCGTCRKCRHGTDRYRALISLSPPTFWFPPSLIWSSGSRSVRHPHSSVHTKFLLSDDSSSQTEVGNQL